MRFVALVAVGCICGVGLAGGAEITLWVTPSGDANYAWNSKYGPSGYPQGANELGVMLQMNAPYGNDYSVGLIEIPISSLHGGRPAVCDAHGQYDRVQQRLLVRLGRPGLDRCRREDAHG
jgi:hypothetical protein